MMSRRRKNRRDAAEQSVQAPVAPTGEGVPDEHLRALTDRLAALEQAQAPDAPWSPADAHRLRHAAWITENTRTDAADLCPACGQAGGEQRRTGIGVGLLPTTWLCGPCATAVEPGWGTASRTLLGPDAALDRLACTAAGMSEPTENFRTLAGRYGLTFTLARDNHVPSDGTAWGHLDTSRWAEVGIKAAARAAANIGVIPGRYMTRHMFPERTVTHVRDPFDPFSSRLEYVTAAAHDVTATEEAAWLANEEAAVDQVLKTRVREQKEREAQEERDRRRAEILAHYQEHAAKLDTEISEARGALRAQLTRALDAAL